MMSELNEKKTQDDPEFYEAMPGTIERPYMRQDAADREIDNDEAEDRPNRSILPWLLLPALLLLGWILASAINNRASNQNNTGTGTGTQQQSGSDALTK